VHCEKNGRNTSKDDKVIFLHDNAQSHVAKVVKKYLETLKWDVLSHPYSPDIIPSDYWLFRKMQPVHFFRRNRKLAPKLDPNTSHFFEMEFENCLRWEKVVGSDGQYFN